MNVWISGDWHLWSNHYNTDHPFRSDRYINNLTSNYATAMRADDVFIFLGDLCDPEVVDADKVANIIKGIPGYKVLCKGNHDTQENEYYLKIGFDAVCEVCVIHNIIFSHFPIKVEPDQLNVHGHVHTEESTGLGYNYINGYDPDMHLGPIKLEDLIKNAMDNVREETQSRVHVDPKRKKPDEYVDKKFNAHRTSIVDLSDVITDGGIILESVDIIDEIIFEDPEDTKYWMADDGKAEPNYMDETSLKSVIDPDFKSRGSKKLSSFKRISINQDFIDANKKDVKLLTHINPTAEDYKSYAWMDGDDVVAVAAVDYNNFTGYKWITAVEVTDAYRGYGLGNQLLKYSVNEMKGEALTVAVNNEVARKMYEKFGFKISKDSAREVKSGKRTVYFMYQNFTSYIKNETATKSETSTNSHELRVSSKDTTNPNDPVSTKAVHLDFYDKDEHVGKVFISSVDTDNGFIYNLVVPKKYRGQGYGRQIMEYALNHYKVRELTVEEDNTVAVTLYKSMGFKLKKTFTDSETHKKMLWMRCSGRSTVSESNDSVVDTDATDQYDKGDSTTDELYGERTPYFSTQEPVDGTIRQYSIRKVNESTTSKTTVYCISEKDLDGTTLKPRIPDNFLTKNGYEDDKTKRVCFCPTISKCLVALSQNNKGKTFNVYEPDGDYELYRPSLEQVPDSSITGEVWITEPVKLKLVERILCTGPARSPSMKYTYGDGKSAELYYWSYHTEELNESTTSSIDFGEYVNPSHLEGNIYVAYRAAEDREFYIQTLRDSKSPHAKEALKSELESSDMRLLYIHDNKIAASCEIDIDKPAVSSLYVEPEYRRKGFAEALMQVAINKYAVTDLEVYRNNSSAIALYKKSGFVKDKNLKDGLMSMRRLTNMPAILELAEKLQFGPSMNEAATNDDGKKFPIFIMLMHSGTSLANVIKGATRAEFSHSSISFDSSMKNMYSFGRKKSNNPMTGSFKRENIYDEFFTERVIPYALYVVMVSKFELESMKKRLEFFINNSTKFVYDKFGLVKNFFGVADEPEYKYFCTRFVADILNAGKTKLVDEPSLVKPDDFKAINGATYVTGGTLSEYNKKKVDKKVKFISNSTNLKTAVNETVDLPHHNPYAKIVLSYQLATMTEAVDEKFLEYIKAFKLRFDKDGNIMITRREYEQLRLHYNKALRDIKACEKNVNTTGVKESLCKLYHIINIIDRYYLSAKAKENVKTEKVRKDIIGLRAAVLTKFQQHVLFVTQQEPGFNFKSYYDTSEYAKNTSNTVVTQLGKTISIPM